MSDWRKMAEDFVLNAVTLGGWGAGRVIGEAIRDDAQKPSGGAGSVIGMGPGIGGSLIGGLLNPSAGKGTIQPPTGARPRQPADDCTTVVGPPPAMGAAGSAGSAAACCNRFSFEAGYLLDGATGDLWKLNGRGDALDAVPRKRSKVEQALREKMAERELQSIAAAYADEALVGLPAAVRTRQLKAFDKSILEPMRAVVRGG
jgi:hypothetical protein